MIDRHEIVADALTAAGVGYTGVNVLGVEATVLPGWFVITRGDGIRVRVDGVDPGQQALATATVNAVDLSPGGQTTADIVKQRAAAAADVIANSVQARKDRGIAKLAIDELNVLRGWITLFKAAVAAATTLADLKTRVAALPNMPDRTLLQAKPLIQNAANSAATD